MSIDWQRVKQVLAEAAARNSPTERAAYLDDVCRGDEPLRVEVEKLLQAHEQAEGFLEQSAIPAFAADLSPGITEKTGDRIGPYKLLEPIGEGGCGVVYMAEQEQPIRRRVALKVIKLGMDTQSVIARFEAERQALALMDHPNIARVLDAGTTDTGRPYFVMELVRGIKITDYCEQNHLSTEERLNLFVQVCHALQHAHQKGIIHRDIKPSNILVTLQDGQPVPKVIDFGIAKATDQRLTDRTLFTAFEQFLGTPAYMSPEQAQMSTQDIDTRSDIYALGVLLYEMLIGKPPFDPKELVSAGLDGMRRIIQEEEPKRPSTRLSGLAVADQTTVAKCRQSEPPQLIHRLRGDLDWIVMRCLEKDRTRRYETANNLAEDVQRHLNKEPVMARPPSRLYQFQKLVQRNKITFAAGGLVTAALVVGLGFSLWTQAKERVARRQALVAEGKAQAEAGKSQQVAQFLKDMLRGVGPSMALGRDTTMLREILDKTSERVGQDLHDHPEVEAELRMTLGEVYEALGQFDKAEAMFQVVIKLQRALWGNRHTNVADSLDRLGWELLSRRVKVEESEPLLQEAFTIRTNLLGAEHVQVAASQCHLGVLRLWQVKTREGEMLVRQSLATRRRLLGDQSLEVAESLTGLGQALTDLNRGAQAETFLREAMAIQTRLFPDERAVPDAGNTQFWLGLALRRQGKLDQAEAVFRKAVALRRELLGVDHPNVAVAMEGLANVLVAGTRVEEATTVAREALGLSRKNLGERHPTTAFCWEELGLALRKAGKFAESESAYREALAFWDNQGHINADIVRTSLEAVLRQQGKLAQIEDLAREAVVVIRKTGSAERLVTALLHLGVILSQHNHAAEAEISLREALTVTQSWPSSNIIVRNSLLLAQLLLQQGRETEVETMLDRVLECINSSSDVTSLVDEFSHQALRLGTLQAWLGKDAEHTSLCRRMILWAKSQDHPGAAERTAKLTNLRPLDDAQMLESTLALARRAVELGKTSSSLPWYHLALGMAEYRNGHYSEAVRWCEAAEQGNTEAEILEVRTGIAIIYRAMSLSRQGQLAAARQLFKETEAKIKPLPKAGQWPLTEGVEHDDLILWLACKEARELLKAP
jgi:eukaryotic-like serine/threonine-protein kinase